MTKETYPIVERLTRGNLSSDHAGLVIEYVNPDGPAAARTIEELAGMIKKALVFVEEMESRHDTHFLIGGELYETLSNLRSGQGLNQDTEGRVG